MPASEPVAQKQQSLFNYVDPFKLAGVVEGTPMPSIVSTPVSAPVSAPAQKQPSTQPPKPLIQQQHPSTSSWIPFNGPVASLAQLPNPNNLQTLPTMPVSLFATPLQYYPGRLVAASDTHVCYAVKNGKIRIIEIASVVAGLVRGHMEKVVDMELIKASSGETSLLSAAGDGVLLGTVDQGAECVFSSLLLLIDLRT